MESDSFDADATFNDDYLWFYEPHLTSERSRQDTDEILLALNVDGRARILDVPCGHGRISNLLASDGHQVTGIDAASLFLERAESDAARIGVNVDYRRGDMRDLPVDGPFDAVVCWFTSFGYFDDSGNRSVLDQFARVLKPGGTLLIETIHHDGFVRRFDPAADATVTERGDDSMTDELAFDPLTGRIETDRVVRRDGQTRRSHHSVRLPTVPEFDAWLSAAGFRQRRYTGRRAEPLTHDTMRLVVIATK